MFVGLLVSLLNLFDESRLVLLVKVVLFEVVADLVDGSFDVLAVDRGQVFGCRHLLFIT